MAEEATRKIDPMNPHIDFGKIEEGPSVEDVLSMLDMIRESYVPFGPYIVGWHPNRRCRRAYRSQNWSKYYQYINNHLDRI